MKVLQINSVCGVGSTGKIAKDIHDILIENGHSSSIAYGREKINNFESTISIGNKVDNYLHVIYTRIFDKHGHGSKKATREFINKVNRLNPDIIHLHNIHGYYLNYEILFAYLKKINKPVVWTLHDCWPFTGHCCYFDFVGCDCWKIEGDHHCKQKKSYPASLVFNNSKNNYARKKAAFTGIQNLRIITPSKWLANIVKKSFLKDYPISVINNGIDLDIFKQTSSDFRVKYNLENKYLILGVASTWDRRKGLNYFIELSKVLNDDEKIILIGLTNKQKKKLPKNIIGITRTNSAQELAEIYTSANVFVNPTLEDNYPTTNLESIACGTPVVTFNTGGSIESVDKNTGLVVEKGNLKELIKAITHIKNNRLFNSEEIINKAIESFNKNEKFNEYLNVYGDLKNQQS